MPGLRALRTIVRAVRQHHRQARAATGKGITRQALEIAYAKLRGFSSADYYILPLYRGDRWDYLGQPSYSRLNAHLNPAHAGAVGFNKWVSWHFFIGAGLPAPAVHGFYHPRRGVDRDGQPLRTRDQLIGLLARRGAGLVLKPVDGGQGRNLLVLAECNADGAVRSDGTRMDHDALFDFLAREDEGWLIQYRVEQHPDLARVHPSSLNTLRIMTLVLDDGTITTTIGRLRMGRGGGAHDNSSAGGLTCQIDLATGHCGAAMLAYGDERFATHPDTGAAIEGLAIPHWQAAHELVERAHALLPFPRDLGWDVGVTPDGPVLIETNSYWASHTSQKPDNNLAKLAYGPMLSKVRRAGPITEHPSPSA